MSLNETYKEVRLPIVKHLSNLFHIQNYLKGGHGLKAFLLHENGEILRLNVTHQSLVYTTL